MKEISQDMPQPSINKIILKISHYDGIQIDQGPIWVNFRTWYNVPEWMERQDNKCYAT